MIMLVLCDTKELMEPVDIDHNVPLDLIVFGSAAVSPKGYFIASRSQRVSLIVVPGCLFVCLFVVMFVCPRQWMVLQCCCAAAAGFCIAAAVLLRSSSRLLRSSSKVKAGQWVTKNPTRLTILDRIC